jgi:hypothetical protein
MHRRILLIVAVCSAFSPIRPSHGTPVHPASTDPTTDSVILDSGEMTTPAAETEVKRKVKDSRLYASPVVEETVTNEVSEKNFEDMEFLCHHFYKDEFVVSAHVTESGCRLECVFLKSSGVHGSGFFDTSVRKDHNINEGQTCDPQNVSRNEDAISSMLPVNSMSKANASATQCLNYARESRL